MPHKRLDRVRVIDAGLQRDVARAHVHVPRSDELAQALVESPELEQCRQRARIAVAVVLFRDLERVHVLALGAAEVADRVAAVGRLLDERQLLQVEETVGTAAHGERAVEELRRNRVLVLRRVHGAEARERHHEPPGRDALRAFEELEGLAVAAFGGRIVGELVLRRAEVVVRDRQLVVALAAGLG